tara:strand:+ start:24543 stop:24938 length:396 start_codon:yes stop_codon:yes gene_type:complete
MSEPPRTALEWLFGGGLIAAGGGIKWLWDQWTKRADKRQAELDAREHEIEEREAASVKKMEERLDALESKVSAQGVELEAHRIAIHIMVAKVARDDPQAPELKQVAEILGSAFPAFLHTPSDMIAMLAKID